jgi:protein-S-isoprenylcysteine O-methyltransferase Ste14
MRFSTQNDTRDLIRPGRVILSFPFVFAFRFLLDDYVILALLVRDITLWGLAFRSRSGVVIALLLLVPFIPRIHSEERLPGPHFGAEYDAYVARTWRLIAGIY